MRPEVINKSRLQEEKDLIICFINNVMNIRWQEKETMRRAEEIISDNGAQRDNKIWISVPVLRSFSPSVLYTPLSVILEPRRTW